MAESCLKMAWQTSLNRRRFRLTSTYWELTMGNFPWLLS
jgi:hypothetical protein